MDYVGLITLIHPAILCLVVGTAMFVAGITWLTICRYLSKRWIKVLSVIFVFVISCTIFTLVVYFKFGLLPVYFETISPL